MSNTDSYKKGTTYLVQTNSSPEISEIKIIDVSEKCYKIKWNKVVENWKQKTEIHSKYLIVEVLPKYLGLDEVVKEYNVMSITVEKKQNISKLDWLEERRKYLYNAIKRYRQYPCGTTSLYGWYEEVVAMIEKEKYPNTLLTQTDKQYTKEDLNNARKEAFEAARIVIPEGDNELGWEHTNYDDYLKTII